MDGLLFDTEPVYFRVIDEMLRRRGLRYTHDLQRQLMGRVGVAAAQIIVEHHNFADAPEDVMDECGRDYAAAIDRGVDDRPGLKTLIDAMNRRGLPFGLATSSFRRFVDVLFKTRSWGDDLRFLITGDDVTRGKPDPQIYQMAAEAAGVACDRMMVLEDSENGIRAAAAAGCIAIAVPNDQTADHDFSAADAVVERLDDPQLLAWIDAANFQGEAEVEAASFSDHDVDSKPS